MRTVRTRLPCELTSNLVFSSGADVLFALSASGDLVCMTVPSGPEGAIEPATIVPQAEHGAFVAAGWLEGRLATIAVSDGELRLSHGWPGIVGETPSSPARVSLADSGMRFSPGRRLQPYVRWFQEINPIEVIVVGESLVLDDDGQLFGIVTNDVLAKPEKAKCSAYRIAEHVSSIAGLEEHGIVAFVGCLPQVKPKGVLRRLARDETAPSCGAFVLMRMYVGGPARIPGIDVVPTNALVHLYKPEDNTVLVAAASAQPRGKYWTLIATHPASHQTAQRQDFELGPGDRILGLSMAGEPSIVVTEEPFKDLVLVSWRGRSSLPRLDAVIDDVAVAPSGPPLIAVLSRPNEIVLCWPTA